LCAHACGELICRRSNRWERQAATRPLWPSSNKAVPRPAGGRESFTVRCRAPTFPCPYTACHLPARVAASDRGLFPWRGWLLGDEQSDEPCCRYICLRRGIFVSVRLPRHAPDYASTRRQRRLCVEAWMPITRRNSAASRDRLMVAGAWSPAAISRGRHLSSGLRDRGGPKISARPSLCRSPLHVYRPSLHDKRTGYFLRAR